MLLINAISNGRINEVMEAMYHIVSYITEHEDGQDGGVLRIAEINTGLPLLTCFFGVLKEEELRECDFFATEKIERLSKNRSHWASSQSRDIHAVPKRYAGAVRTRNFFLSFSGFTESQDEAAMLVLAIMLGEISVSSATTIAEITRNQYFNKLMTYCCANTF